MTKPIKTVIEETLHGPSQVSSKNNTHGHLSWKVEGLAQNYGSGQDGSFCFHGLGVKETLAELGEGPRKGLQSTSLRPSLLDKAGGSDGALPPWGWGSSPSQPIRVAPLLLPCVTPELWGAMPVHCQH